MTTPSSPAPAPRPGYQIGSHPPIPAFGTPGYRPVCGIEVHDQDGFGPSYVPTALTEVVLRLRKHWLDGCAQDWGVIRAVSRLPMRDFDQRVALSLCEGFTHFSQLLACLEVLLLQRQQLSPESERTLLGIQDHVVELAKLNAEQMAITQLQSTTDQGDGLAQAASNAADQ